jgi:hypothetical protein
MPPDCDVININPSRCPKNMSLSSKRCDSPWLPLSSSTPAHDKCFKKRSEQMPNYNNTLC